MPSALHSRIDYLVKREVFGNERDNLTKPTERSPSGDESHLGTFINVFSVSIK